MPKLFKAALGQYVAFKSVFKDGSPDDSLPSYKVPNSAVLYCKWDNGENEFFASLGGDHEKIDKMITNVNAKMAEISKDWTKEEYTRFIFLTMQEALPNTG